LLRSVAAAAAALVASVAGHPVAVTTAQAATCSQYSNQAAAQRARDTRDADGDDIYDRPELALQWAERGLASFAKGRIHVSARSSPTATATPTAGRRHSS
jgi:hypothetical protein